MAPAVVVTPFPASKLIGSSELDVVGEVWEWVLSDFNHPKSPRPQRLKPVGGYTAYRVMDDCEIRDESGQIVEIWRSHEMKYIRFDYEAAGCPSERS